MQRSGDKPEARLLLYVGGTVKAMLDRASAPQTPILWREGTVELRLDSAPT